MKSDLFQKPVTVLNSTRNPCLDGLRPRHESRSSVTVAPSPFVDQTLISRLPACSTRSAGSSWRLLQLPPIPYCISFTTAIASVLSTSSNLLGLRTCIGGKFSPLILALITACPITTPGGNLCFTILDAMCRYQYYYYCACRHCELLLFDYCDQAHDVAPADSGSPGAGTEADGKSDDDPATDPKDEEGGSSDRDDTASPSIFSSPSPHQQHHHKDSSVADGSVSITAEPDYDCASLPSQHLSPSSPPSTTASLDMAGLPLFGHTFRSWMGGSSVTSPKQTNVESQGHVLKSGKRSIEAVSVSRPVTLSSKLTVSLVAARYRVWISFTRITASSAWNQRAHRREL